MLGRQHQVYQYARTLSSRLLAQNIQLIPSAQMHKNTTEVEEPASFVNEDLPEVKPANFYNKSGLRPAHRKMLQETLPYDEPHSWIHLTEKYQRKMFGRYGSTSNVNPRICFPTKKQLEDANEYEKVAYPHTLVEMIEQNKIEKEAKRLSVWQRDEEIVKKLEKLEQWKADLKAKVDKSKADALASKERKERLIEEVRRHFGFKIDARDDRFKELLEQKEREDRKKQKEAKRKVKEDKMMAKMAESFQNK